MKKLKHILLNMDSILAAGLMVAVICMVILNVFMRFFTDHSIPWSEEMVSFVYVWAIMLGAAAVHRKHGHICIEMAVDLLPSKIQHIVNLCVDFVTCGICYVISYLSYDYAINGAQKTTGILRIPYRYEYYAFTVGFFLMACYSIPYIIRGFRALKKGGHAE